MGMRKRELYAFNFSTFKKKVVGARLAFTFPSCYIISVFSFWKTIKNPNLAIEAFLFSD